MVINLNALCYILLVFCFATTVQADDNARIPSDYSVQYQRQLSSEIEDRNDKRQDPQAVIGAIMQQWKRNEENALCCIKIQPRSKRHHSNNIQQLIDNLHDHIYTKNKGTFKVGEQFPLILYYDSDITILDLHYQLIEAGFRIDSVQLGKGCIGSDSLEYMSTCKNIDLCQNCEFEITYLYDELRYSSLFSLGHPIYQIKITSRGSDFEGFVQLGVKK